ncbi:hypothetical protein SAMN05519103_09423 [Rhizobiales bacterium GAS113]|nr:hypothetical protein SAMN05519103_09423 [Rhizobiales bacterium GAS113]
MTQTSLPADTLPLQDSRIENRNPDSLALQRYPILIGISGKRIFDKTSVKADCASAVALADRFRTLFEALDQDLPETPKIVLTGAAFGTDLIAAETALQIGRNWAVAVVLPFDRVLFEEDFHPSLGNKLEQPWRDRYVKHARTFERILGSLDKPNPRVLVRELPKLSVEGGGVATVDQLSRRAAQYDKTLRRNHYEQVGQFIAEISTIMVAVMSGDEQPEISEANGGTARIVAYRRAGCPDAVGTTVARRSAVLRRDWPEVKLLPAGYVWLMDPQKADRSGRYPVKVLPPLTDRLVADVYAGHPGQDAAQEHDAYAGPLRKLTNALRTGTVRLSGDDPEKRAESRRLRASLAVARGFERYHREGTQTPGRADAAIAVDLSHIRHVPNALNSARARISLRQRKVNAYAKRDFKWLAFLFVLAVILFESFAEIFHKSLLLLGLYLGVLAWIGFKALHGRWMLRDALAEDYRAVAEILRVQRAWWSAGLTARVDREHLQGVDQDLAPIRECAKTIIAWILLRHGWRAGAPIRDWAHVRGTSVRPRDLRGKKRPPDDWIGGQLWYFINNVEDRETQANIYDARSWCLFVASGALGAVLWTWLAFPKAKAVTMFAHMAHIHLPSWTSTIGFDIRFLLWLLLAALVIKFRILNHDIRRGLGAILLTGASGVLAAIGFALAVVSAEPFIVGPTRVHDAVIAGLVVLSAIAGAQRFLMEKLNIEAEALEYRDARGRFERGERLLARGSDPGTGAPANEEAAKRLVYELGCLALAENEAWLKSRRERPLTPVVA